jgi:hypothetical protein
MAGGAAMHGSAGMGGPGGRPAQPAHGVLDNGGRPAAICFGADRR